MIQQISSSLQGRRLVSAIQANPAAGDNVLIVVPATVSWEIVALTVFLTAGAGGGNRRQSLQITVGLVPTLLGIIHDTIAAGSTNLTYWVAGAEDYFDFGAVLETYQRIPQGLILPPGSTLGTNTVNIGALDQYNNINFTYYETLTP